MAKIINLKLSKRLMAFVRPYGWWIALTIVVSFIYAALSSLPILLIQPLLDKGVIPALGGLKTSLPKGNINPFNQWLEGVSPESLMTTIAYIIIPLVVLVAVFDYLREYLPRYVTLKILMDLRNKTCAHILNLSMGFFTKKKAGDLMSRLTNDVATTQSALEFLFGDIIQQPLRILTIFVAMFALNWWIALVILLVLPFLSYPIFKLGSKVRQSKIKSLVKLSDVTESMHQMFSGIRVVKSFRMEEAEMREFAQDNWQFLRKSLSVARAKSLSLAVLTVIGGVVLAAALLWMSYLIISGYITLGTALGLVVCLSFLPTPARSVAKAINTLQESTAGADRIFELHDLNPAIQDEPDAVNLPDIREGIKFDHLSFAYENELVLKDIDFMVKPGEIVAIVGPTGAGKSTLLDLVARFYDPAQGGIEIDGINIRRIKRESLINHIAIVGQETFLFNAPVRENIKYGKRDATEEEIISAAKSAQIHDVIANLEKGYDTELGERGARLSGGERQRIAIARAILKNPAILLLDEATSALDSESERLVQNALNNLMQGRTTFVIAHRLSTVQHAHQIIVLENGRIAQRGTHQELLNQEGLYKKLYQTQFGIS